MVVLGDEVVDVATGFSGTVVAIVTYLHGSPRAYVAPLMQDYGDVPQEMFIELGRLTLKQSATLRKV